MILYINNYLLISFIVFVTIVTTTFKSDLLKESSLKHPQRLYNHI